MSPTTSPFPAVRRLPWLVAVLLGVAALSPARADDELATDRPDFVESSSVVGRGVFQVETSVAHERDARAGVRTRTTTTPTLLRLGVSERLELRLESDGLVRQWSSDAGRERGTADASVGAKWQLREGDEATGTAAVALIGSLDLDTGSAAFRAPGPAPTLRLVAEWELPGDASVGVMPGVSYPKDEAGRRFWSGILAVTCSRPLTESVRGFVEVAGRELRSARHGGNQVTFDTGVTVGLGPDLQLDVSVNLALTRDTPDRAVAIGLSKRFR